MGIQRRLFFPNGRRARRIKTPDDKKVGKVLVITDEDARRLLGQPLRMAEGDFHAEDSKRHRAYEMTEEGAVRNIEWPRETN